MSELCTITAMDVVTALGAGPEEVWSQMMRKLCGIRPMRRFPRGRYMTDVAAEVPEEVEAALHAREGAQGGRAHLLALSVGRQALRQASEPPRSRIGLILATAKAEIEALEQRLSKPGADSALRSATQSMRPDARFNPAALARDLAAELRLAGPVMAVSSACASGVVAIVQAARLLRRGDAERMLVIGVEVLADFLLSGFSALAALSRAPCAPYDAQRDGLSLGEGAGALLLSRDGEPALGTVRGWAVTNDASHITAPSPTGEGLKLALTRALGMAGLDPRDVHYVNGHGTGTRYNDDMEAKALCAVFAEERPPVSSMKGYFGHTSGAAGVIETALCLMAMREQTVPANLGLRQLDPSLGTLNVPREHLHLDRLTNVLTLKCGFGGVNGVLVLSGKRAA